VIPVGLPSLFIEQEDIDAMMKGKDMNATAEVLPKEFEVKPIEPSPEPLAIIRTPMDLLSLAIRDKANIDVIERLAALQEKAMAKDAESQFNLAMNAAQGEIPRIAPDLNNTQTSSKYASYKALDRVVRPVYLKHGFSLSFDTADTGTPETVRATCYVSHRAGHTRKYQSPLMPADGKGPKGGDVMSKTHATGAAMSYAMRYLLKYIFNIAIGEEDTDGNNYKLDNMEMRFDEIAKAEDLRALSAIFTEHYQAAKKEKDGPAMLALINARDERKKELQ
jgi:hypothetical protein